MEHYFFYDKNIIKKNLSKHMNTIFKINSKDDKSAEDKCPICLVIPIEDRSFADKCFHAFCKVCLVEWSKVRLECPLCRQSFRNIIYDVKSENDFKQIRLEELIRNKLSNASLLLNSVTFSPFFTAPHALRINAINTPFFLNNSNRFNNLGIDLPASNLEPGSIQHRRYIYSADQYVLPGGDGLMRRRRESTAQFYRQNPASTHRLFSFLNLEIRALIHNQNDHEIITPIILSSLTKFNINSIEFQRLISQYFLSRSIHFIHEFYNFAISEFSDIHTYFQEAVYLPKDQVQIIQINNYTIPNNEFNINNLQNRSSESRNIYNEVNNLNQQSQNSNSNLVNRTSPIESVADLVNEYFDSSDSSDIEIVYEGPSNSTNQLNRNKNLNRIIKEEEPKPSTSGLQNERINFLSSNQTNRSTNYSDSDSDYSDTENLNRNNNFHSYYKIERDEINDESIDCEIVNCELRNRRTPELILLTDDEDDISSKRLKTDHFNDNEYLNKEIIKNMTCRCKIKCKGICKKY